MMRFLESVQGIICRKRDTRSDNEDDGGDNHSEEFKALPGRRSSTNRVHENKRPSRNVHGDHPDAFVIRRNDTKKECRQKLKRSFERNKVIMKVSAKDIVQENEKGSNNNSNNNNNHNDLYEGSLILPRAGFQTCTVPNCCIICLESYQPGDVVVWSSNPLCEHAYHQSCILKYLVKIQRKAEKTPCCVCRCQFTDVKVEKRYGRRGTQGRRTVRTHRNYGALSLPFWNRS